MRSSRQTSIILATSLLVLGTTVAFLPLSAQAQSVTDTRPKGYPSFASALDTADAAQRELQSGNAAPYKAVWSRSENVTLIGGFGGGVERGWSKVSQRIDWVASQFSNGSNTIERLVTHASEDVGYVVQVERIRFQVPGQTKESTRDYRVTMFFLREGDGWKLVHRHADSQMMRQAPQ